MLETIKSRQYKKEKKKSYDFSTNDIYLEYLKEGKHKKKEVTDVNNFHSAD